jgi:hypothetical protein
VRSPLVFIRERLTRLAKHARDAFEAREKYFASHPDKEKQHRDRTGGAGSNRDREKTGHPKGDRPGGSKHEKGAGKQKSESNSVQKPLREKQPTKPFCDQCGNDHAHAEDGRCSWAHFKHPGVNKDWENTKWSQSTAGQAAKAAGHKSLPWAKNLDGSPFEMKSKSSAQAKDHKSKDKGNGDLQSLLSHLKELTKAASNLELKILVTNRKGQSAQTPVRGALIDTGAVDNTYLGKRLANRLVARYGAVVRPNSTIIYTPDKGAKPFFSQGELDFDVIIFDEIKKENEKITLTGLIIDSPLDLIIGLPDIKNSASFANARSKSLTTEPP